MTLGSKSHHCPLDNSKLEFIKSLFPSEEAWKGVFQIWYRINDGNPTNCVVLPIREMA
jgi:hypothetical protein